MNKRNKWIIYPSFQYKVILINLALFLMGMVITSASIYLAFQSIERIGQKSGLGFIHPFFVFVNFQKHEVSTFLFISMIVGCLLMILGNIWLSHRLVGPIYKLEKYLTEYVEKGGKIEKIKFRENDFFPGLPALLNSALENKERNESYDVETKAS